MITHSLTSCLPKEAAAAASRETEEESSLCSLGGAYHRSLANGRNAGLIALYGPIMDDEAKAAKLSKANPPTYAHTAEDIAKGGPGHDAAR